MPRRAFLTLFLMLPLFLAAGWVMLQGQDATIDFRNYHVYNAYALLEGREAVDIGVAQRQGFFNPALDVPFYMLSVGLSPFAASVMLGLVQALNVTLLAWLALRVLRESGEEDNKLLAAAVVTGACTPLFLGELGLTMGDSLVSLGVLGALCCLVSGRYALAGLLIGLAVGLKPTNGPYALGLFGAALFLAGRRWFPAGLAYGAAGVAGLLASGGWWAWHLWKLYGNPVFPQFNDVFLSPYAPPSPFLDARYFPKTWWEALAFPLVRNAWTMDAGGDYMHDLRFPLLILAVPCAAAFAALTWRRRVPAQGRTGIALLIFAAVSYVAWLKSFAIYRYLLPLEMLAPLLFAVLLAVAGLQGKKRRVAALAFCAAALASFTPVPFPRAPWDVSLAGAELPGDMKLDGALVVVTGRARVGYAVPSFPASTAFARIDGNLFRQWENGVLSAPAYGEAMHEKLWKRITEHEGELYALYAEDSLIGPHEALVFFQLEILENSCQPLPTRLEKGLHLCRLKRKDV
ncbi:MAG: DUF2029 domain-containing protein [Alphaproteobacteria bacterium]|nr:DUF2029 domain-containing protein [Alphaproteobacteria bacterium]